MVFSDLFFLFAFIPAFALCYLLGGALDKLISRRTGERRHPCKNFMLVLFSLLFYAWGEPVYVLLMLVCVLFNYISGLLISRSEKGRKAWLWVGVGLDIAILGSFKYLNFFAAVLRGAGLDWGDPAIPLPIGISFYIFQSISYLVDVYRRESPAQRSYFGLLLYISMFPQLIAGPIVRYGTVAREIHDRHVSSEDVAEGMYRFLIGLAKKVIIANQFSEIADRFLGGNLHEVSTLGAWVGLGAFMIQIYFDFSGYSDMAIGIGRCLGFRFCENFDHPYVSRSITEFWRRWHMSLGNFFRDYVYIPLGGNRRHQMLNILVVWALTGFWHGASWNFLFWGLYFGVILVAEKYVVLRISSRVPAPLMNLYTLLIVGLGFVIFYFDDLTNMGACFHALFTADNGLSDFAALQAIYEKFWLWIAAIVLCLPVRRWGEEFADRFLGEATAARGSVAVSFRLTMGAVLLLACICLLIGATNNAFLYTRF